MVGKLCNYYYTDIQVFSWYVVNTQIRSFRTHSTVAGLIAPRPAIILSTTHHQRQSERGQGNNNAGVRLVSKAKIWPLCRLTCIGRFGLIFDRFSPRFAAAHTPLRLHQLSRMMGCTKGISPQPQKIMMSSSTQRIWQLGNHRCVENLLRQISRCRDVG